MAYRELSVIEVREVLRRYVLGESVRAIARGTAVDRKTVAKYLRAGRVLGVHPGGSAPTEAQVVGVLAKLRAPGPRGPRDSTDAVRAHQATIQTWLGDGLRLTKIYRRLRQQGLAPGASPRHRRRPRRPRARRGARRVQGGEVASGRARARVRRRLRLPWHRDYRASDRTSPRAE